MAALHPGRDRVVVPDHDGRRLDMTIRALAVMALMFGATDLSLGVVLGRSGVIAQGVLAILGGTWLLSESLRRGPDGRVKLISRMTWVVVKAYLTRPAGWRQTRGRATRPSAPSRPKGQTGTTRERRLRLVTGG
jgi:hypothetical protein